MNVPAAATAPADLFEATVFRAVLRLLKPLAPPGTAAYIMAAAAQEAVDQMLAAGLHVDAHGELQMPNLHRRPI